MATKNILKKNKTVRYLVVFLLALFFFCGKLEVVHFDQKVRQLKATGHSLSFQTVHAQTNPYSTPDPLQETAIEKAETAGKKAASKPGYFERALSWTVTLILGAIKYFCAILLIIAAYFLNAMLSPNLYNFTSEPIITTGWIAVRDVCNLFFLLILLFIAFCTILKIPKYHAKNTLLIFILMALLINFSKPIAIFIFDGSQLLMNFFLMKISSGSGAMSYSERMIGVTELTKGADQLLQQDYSDFGLIAKYIFLIIFYFMLAIAFLVMAFYLLIRIIAIWLLIVVSPFAFLFSAVPDFKKISSDWWDALFKYSYIGPSIAFFLWLSTYLTQSSLKKSIESLNYNTTDSYATWALQYFIPYIVVLVFLYAAIIISQKFGIQFAGAITSRANRALGKAAKLGGTGLLTAGTLGQYRRVKDAYQGIKSGLSQRPGWRVLTKEGQEAISKKRREGWEEKIAPSDISRARRKAKEKENDSKAKIDAGVAKGDAASLLVASKRGDLTPDQLKSHNVRNAIKQNPELRKEILDNLRNRGDLHLAAILRFQTADKNNDDKDKRNWSQEEFGKDEIRNSKNIGNVDWEKFSKAADNFKQMLSKYISDMARINPRGLTNALSTGKNINFIMQDENRELREIITRATRISGEDYRHRETRREQEESEREQSVTQPPIQIVRPPRVKERIVYDEHGKPKTS